MDKCREDFEKWYSKIPQYGAAHKADMLECWKASRENMKAVKLPTKYRTVIDNESFFFNEAVDLCKDAITSAGYKVE